MTTTVKTSKGELRGTAEGGLHVFRGIPFARPPVGELRFRVPQEVASWQGVRDATRFGSRAMQVPNEALESILGRAEDQPPLGEDCLYLNVWTPGLDDRRRPVMVWIHGGGFTIGAGSDAIYDGSALASRDAVVVTINYRLGPFGFLHAAGLADSPEAFAANFGMLDQIAALKWVQSEIAAFGGDPGNVTIFGESAGAMSVGVLLASPPASGLFHKAILQSGAAHQALTEELAVTNATAFAEALGTAELDGGSLRARPAAELLEAQVKMEAEAAQATRRGLGLGLRFQPVIDGRVISQLPIEHVRGGSAKDIPVLIGTTLDEYKLFAVMMPRLREISEDEAAKRFSWMLPGRDIERARSLLGGYRKARAARGEPDDPYETVCAAVTDWLFRVPADRLAEAQSSHLDRVFAYRLDWRSPVGEGILGACHAIDLPFVFGTQRLARRWVGQGDDVDALATRVGDAWVAFARNGDPSTDSLPWPQFDAAGRKTMVLDRECRVEERPHEDERRCWDGVIP
ncbi:MAG TPA: carboxylesterase/lipase family protein [Dehalococcoidia bacterium]|nr:carboxylesterase/lipase family protein [Dehalococcoidia bacterium]